MVFQVGVNASSVMILEHLIRADTASAFNISVGDVNVTGISQVHFKGIQNSQEKALPNSWGALL